MTDTTDTSAEAVERLIRYAEWAKDEAAAEEGRALLARAEKAEAERDENEKVIAVWRGRTQRADAERDRLREALDAKDEALLRAAHNAAAKKKKAAGKVAARAALKEPGHD